MEHVQTGKSEVNFDFTDIPFTFCVSRIHLQPKFMCGPTWLLPTSAKVLGHADLKRFIPFLVYYHDDTPSVVKARKHLDVRHERYLMMMM